MGQTKADLEQKISKIVEKQLIKALEDKEEELEKKLELLQDDEELERLREKRLHELKKKSLFHSKLRSFGHGTYEEVLEREIFEISKKSYYLVVHFYRPTTTRCQILDSHIVKLASKYIETRFVKVNAEKAEFTAQSKQNLVLIQKRKVTKQMIGFEEFGGTDSFSTQDLENALKRYKMITFPIPESDEDSS